MSRHAQRSGVSRWSWLVAAGAVVALILVVRPAWGSLAASPGRAAQVADATPMRTPAPSTTAKARPPRATPAPKPKATAVRVPTSASGRLAAVPGTAGPSAPGTPMRYRLEIEQGLPFDGAQVAAQIQQVLTDPRGWQPIENVAFARVAQGPADFTLILASPSMTDRLCYPLDTVGQLSCRNGDKVILNALRWATAVPWFRGDVDLYRAYQVNHEVGHRLGHGHAYCHGAGSPAPVMMQQSKGVGACRPNAWPSVAAD